MISRASYSSHRSFIEAGQGQRMSLLAELVPELDHLGAATEGSSGHLQGRSPAGDLWVDYYVQAIHAGALLQPKMPADL